MKGFVRITLFMLAMLAAATAACTAAGPTATKSWSTASGATVQIPSELEIVDVKPALLALMEKGDAELAKQAGELAKQNGGKELKLSAADMKAMLEKYQVGLYQLAEKRDGSYNTAFLATTRLPDELNLYASVLLMQAQSLDKGVQGGLERAVTEGINQGLALVPEWKDNVKVEVLEWYPVENITAKKAKITTLGGSLALRMYGLIQPVAFKAYFVNDGQQTWLFLLVNAGADRKMWEELTGNMLSQL